MIILLTPNYTNNNISTANAPLQVIEPSRGVVREKTILMECTGYCNCYKCTGKHLNNKAYGITASGVTAGLQTAASDWTVLPPGTRIEIPGIGKRIIQDKGGVIKGNKLDIWFSSHDEALKFERKTLEIKVLEE